MVNVIVTVILIRIHTALAIEVHLITGRILAVFLSCFPFHMLELDLLTFGPSEVKMGLYGVTETYIKQ